jgi:hypothetical protein
MNEISFIILKVQIIEFFSRSMNCVFYFFP